MATALKLAVRDFVGSLRRLPLAADLASRDIHGKYKRTVLGPLWIALGQAATVGGFILVFSSLFGLSVEVYAIYLAAGLPVWALISSYLTDMPGAFISAKGFIESYEIPWLTHIWRRSIAYVYVFAHQVITLFAVMAIQRIPPKIEMLYAIPALLIVTVAGAGIGIALAVIGARYRDLQPAMSIFAGVAFLFSPVMWRADQLHVNQWVVQYNPLHYVISLLRDPLLGVAPSLRTWMIGGGVALGTFAIGVFVFLASRRRLYHWL